MARIAGRKRHRGNMRRALEIDHVIIVDERNRGWGTLFQVLMTLATPLILL